MCGFAGFLGQSSTLPTERLLVNMADQISHRGPDGSGIWYDAEQQVGLSHRRLAIVDLSVAGHQPMASADGRYLIAFNGEIYNHLVLREELLRLYGVTHWRGHSDTETLLAAIDRWGVREAVGKLTGMFAFALWDKATHTLTLARDRAGEKPLYYGWQSESFLFGSELKALRAHPAFQSQIDKGALSLYLRHSYVPAPYSIYKGISKLEPGCLLTVSLQHRDVEIFRYWSGAQNATSGAEHPFSGTPAQAVDGLDVLLKDAIKQQMVADVPLGAFLSGGVDSSTVVALMQAQASQPVKTFTIGFHEEAYNEAVHAKAVAKHLGTDHTELYVSADQAIGVIPLLPNLYDEPFADSSQLPTFLVSQLARQHVTVSLSGDAGDELFCGYNRYKLTNDLWRRLESIPPALRNLAAKALTSLSPRQWDSMGRVFGLALPRNVRLAQLGDKVHKGAGVLASTSADELYRGLVSAWHDPAAIVINGAEPPTLLSGNVPDLNDLGVVERMMALDFLGYLPDDVLAKVDRAAMGVSLETRVPFLDHRVIEMASRLPLDVKLKDGQSKWVLRQVLYRYVPHVLIDRPKMGFGVPIDSWLRGALRPWAESLLDESRLRREGYFHPAEIRLKWEQHIAGQLNWQHQLWNVLMFQAWLESQDATAHQASQGA